MRHTALTDFWRSERGASAMEFVLVLPILLTLTIGVINASLMIFATSTLHYATEDAARWCMVHASTCSATTVNDYAKAQFAGPASSPTFTLTAAACAGKQVTGAATYTFVTGVKSISVPLSATACHPLG